MLDWPLLTGAAPLAVQITAVIGAVWLIARTLRSHRSLWAKVAELTLCLGFAAGLTALLDHLARTVWMLFPDRLDPAIYGWVGAGIFAVTLLSLGEDGEERTDRFTLHVWAPDKLVEQPGTTE